MERRAGAASVATIADGAINTKQRFATLLLTSTILGASIIAVPKSYAQQATPASSASQAVNFSIPAQPLSSAINAFIRQTGWQISYTSALARGKTSGAVVGSLTPSQALQRLVAGTGLRVRVGAPGSAALVDPSVAAVDTVNDGSTMLDTIEVQGSQESAWGPVDGYVATQSATGTKTDTPLIETPQSISVVGRQEMTDRNVQSINDAISYTPSVKTDSWGAVSNGNDSFILRGFSDTSQYLDGTLSSAWLEPYGLERVEVLRGPSSILYGQASPGGMVNSVSKRPTADTLREVGLATTEYGGIQGFFDFGGTLDKDGQFLYRLTGLGKNLGTEFENGSRYQRVFIAPAITWQPTDDTKLTVLAKYQYDPRILALPNVPAEGTLWSRPDGFRFPRDWYNSDPAYDKNSYKRMFQIGYDFEHKFNESWTVRQNLRYEHIENESFYLTAIPFGTQTNLSRTAHHGYGTTKTFTVDTNAETRFSTGAIEHNALFGIDYRRISTLSKSGEQFGVDQINIFNPVYGVFDGPAPTLTSGSDQSNSQIGLYAQDQIKWDQWTLLIGGRYDWADSKTYDAFNDRTLTNEMDQSAFTKRIGLVYEFSNGIAPYVSYAESFQPQSGTTSPARGSEAFKPTTGRQYEAGIKYKPSFMDALFTVAVYDLRRQNVLTVDPNDGNYSVQTGEIASRGLELTGTANVTNNLRLNASYSYLNAETTKDNTPANIGKTPSGVPMHQASAWLDYTFDTGMLAGLGLGAGARYIGKSPGDGANTFEVPGVTLIDAALRYDFGAKNPNLKGLQLSVNAQNLFNKEYISVCGSEYVCYYGKGRTVFGTLTYKW